VSVTVSGLDASGLVLQDNGGDALHVAADGVSTFAVGLAPGAAYSVSVAAQPGGSSQFCRVANGSGTIGTSDVSDVTVTCKDAARFAFTANSDNTVSAYTVDPVTGALKSVGPPQVVGTVGTTVGSIAADPAGKFVFLLDTTNKALLCESIDRSSGALTVVGFIGIPGTPQALAVSPNGRFVYVANDSTWLTIVSVSSTGKLSSVPSGASTNTGTTSMTIDPTGKFLYVPDGHYAVEAFELDSVSGAAVELGHSGGTSGPESVAVTPTGFAYVVDGWTNGVDIYPIPATGLIDSPTHVSTGSKPFYIAADVTGRFIYVADTGEARISVFSADPKTGALTPGKDFVGGATPFAIVADPTGRFVYTTNPAAHSVSAFSIDPTTGTLTKVGGDVPAGAAQAIALTK
jgi:6-phosphogluconolactonase (cycloisomerase 2 family)